MIYLDHGATSFPKAPGVTAAMTWAVEHCANPGRGGYGPSMEAARILFETRERAGRIFGCEPDRVVFTPGCTYGLNLAIRTLVKPGGRVVISGFEHNAVTRPLHHLGAEITVAGRKLFSRADTLERLEDALRSGVQAAVFTHCSNVFGYILPVGEMGQLCRHYGVPFVVDAAQSAGALPVNLRELGADFIALPGHKGLLGPQGVGLLLCARQIKPLVFGGTGTDSQSQEMPEYLPEGAEPGTVNVPGIAGLGAALAYLEKTGIAHIGRREREMAELCAGELEKKGYRVFTGSDQSGVLSFLPEGDCNEFAEHMAHRGIAMRSGLHCAPLAHESAGTLQTGTVRVSFGHRAGPEQVRAFLSRLP